MLDSITVSTSDLQCSLSYEVNNRKFFVCRMSAFSQSEARIISYAIIGFIVWRGALNRTYRIYGASY